MPFLPTVLTIFSLSTFLPARASDRVSPDVFLGSYKLKHAVYGLCAPEIQVLKTDSVVRNQTRFDLQIGPYDFLAINEPRTEYDNEMEKGSYESHTTSDNKAFRQARAFIKALQQTDVVYTLASLKNGILHITDREKSWSPRSGVIRNSITECVYSLVEGPKPNPTPRPTPMPTATPQPTPTPTPSPGGFAVR